MKIQVIVDDQKMRIPSNLRGYISGSQEFIYFEFGLSQEWDVLKLDNSKT